MIYDNLFNQVITPKVFAYEDTIKLEKERGVYADYEELPKEDYVVKSFDGYEIHCTFAPLEGSNRYIIISHGHTYTRIGSVKYLHLFRKLGFQVIIYDDRGCGKNAPSIISMGYNESKDLSMIIADTREKFGENIYLGLHGESMGSALSLMALEKEKNIKFLVSDCGYSDLFILLVEQTKVRFQLPKVYVKRASKICRKKYGFSFEEISPYKCILSNETPICFIHGECDTGIYPSHCQKLYDSTKGYREIHFFPNANHAESYYSDPIKYEQIVQDFLKNIELNITDGDL